LKQNQELKNPEKRNTHNPAKLWGWAEECACQVGYVCLGLNTWAPQSLYVTSAWAFDAPGEFR
jgi:hypothetical protein